TAIGHRSRTRGSGTAENKFKIADRNLTESRQILLVQIETEHLSIERNRALNFFDLISNAPKS
ncbi:MAG: hypothetical protein WBL68_12435, partial [Nitrososphaeraceae archaeon]